MLVLCAGLLISAGCEDLGLGPGKEGENNERMEEQPANQVAGRVCHAIDFRFPEQCGSANLKGVQVLERATTVT